jgi:hypothetical protein
MKDQRLEVLLHGYFDGQLPPLDVRELDARIRTEPEARRRFWELARVHGELRVWGERQVAREHVGLTLEQMELPAETPRWNPAEVLPEEIVPSGWRRWPWMVAALAALLILGALLGGARFEGGWWRQPPGPETLAWVLVESGVVFAPGKAPGPHGAMAAGQYELLEGSAHVRVENGVDLTLQAPVCFDLKTPLLVTLHSGALRVLVPETAHGFTVATPQARFEDLGTEFGVSADASGRSALRVFDGTVRVRPSEGEQVLALVQLGESVAVEAGELRRVPPLSEEVFPSRDAVAFRHWQLESGRMRKDPGLVFYYGFEPDANAPGRLPDTAEVGVRADGQIAGANWVSGRWPGKMALQFENPGDAVRLAVPGEYTDATMATWIRIDRLDQPLNAVLNTSGWGPGGFHWQVSRSATPLSSGIFAGRSENRGPAGRVPLGRWIHLAVVLDAGTREMRHYLNGHLVGLRFIDTPNFKVSLKAACLGRLEEWLPGDHRELRGRMDEFAMWRRALSGEELRRLAESGAPLDAGPGR